MTLKSDAKFEVKVTCVFENDTRNFANFNGLENSDFICNGGTQSK